MNTYLLMLRNQPTTTLIVRAESHFEARAVAYNLAGDRAWMNARQTICQPYQPGATT